MNFLSIDGALKNIVLFSKVNNKCYFESFQSKKNNYENLSVLLIKFLNKNNINLNKIQNIFVNQGPGNFSALRTSIAVAKGFSITKNLKIFGYNCFFLGGSKFFNEPFVLLIYRNEKSFYFQEFQMNLKIDTNPKIIHTDELESYSNKKLILFLQNLEEKNEFKYLGYLKNLHFRIVDYRDILFLYNKNLITKKLIKPLYLS